MKVGRDYLGLYFMHGVLFFKVENVTMLETPSRMFTFNKEHLYSLLNLEKSNL